MNQHQQKTIVVFGCGEWKVKGRQHTGVKWLREMIAKDNRFILFEVNEFYTSQSCSICHSRAHMSDVRHTHQHVKGKRMSLAAGTKAKNAKWAAVKLCSASHEPLHPHRKRSTRYLSRDANAARNIGRRWWCALFGGFVPQDLVDPSAPDSPVTVTSFQL